MFPNSIPVGNGSLAGKLVSFANIKGDIPSTGQEWGMVLDEEGNPFFMVITGYDWNKFLVVPDRGFTFFATAESPAMAAQRDLELYGPARSAYFAANLSIFKANGWSNYELYGRTGDGYYSPDWQARPVTEPEEVNVRIPITPEMQQNLKSVGYSSYDGKDFALIARVNKWSRTAYFIGFNIYPTTYLQLDIRKFNQPEKILALVTTLVTIAISVATLNVPGIVSSIAGLALTVSQTVAESRDAIAKALRNEGVFSQQLVTEQRKLGITSGTRANSGQEIFANNDDFPIVPVALAGGALLLAYLFS